MSKALTYRYVAVMRDEDSGEVSRLKAVVARLKGRVTKVEEKVLNGIVHTGVGIEIGGACAKSLNGAIDPCWTLYAKGAKTTESEPAQEEEPKKKVNVKPKPKPKEPQPEDVPLDDGDEGYGTGDDELEAYLAELENRGCSDGEISLMVPSPNKSAKPNAGMKEGGYFCFTRGERPKGNPRLPDGGAK